MGNPQLSRYHTWPNSAGGHFHDSQAYVIGQRATIDKDASELINASLTLKADEIYYCNLKNKSIIYKLKVQYLIKLEFGSIMLSTFFNYF